MGACAGACAGACVGRCAGACTGARGEYKEVATAAVCEAEGCDEAGQGKGNGNGEEEGVVMTVQLLQPGTEQA